MIESPLGPLTLVTDDEGALVGLYLDGQAHFPDAAALGDRDDTVASDAVAQLGEYFAGQRTTFDLRLAPHGTPFQHEVWDALAAIPCGETRSYGQIAQQLGMLGAARAVGAAVGYNPITIIVPRHRIIGSKGALTGYAGGLERKKWLLAHEAALTADS